MNSSNKMLLHLLSAIILLYRFTFLTVDECLSDPCLNGGNCVEEVNGYHCDCSPGWVGTHCETSKSICLGVLYKHCNRKVVINEAIDC